MNGDVLVDAATFTVGADDRAPAVLHRSGAAPPLRCASLLKPLLFWAAAGLPGPAADEGRWAELAGPAVAHSANDPTVTVWDGCGRDALLDRLAELGGTRWRCDPSATPTFGKVLVRATEVAGAYARLAVSAREGDAVADRLLGWMRTVADRQTFGARAAAATSLGVDPSVVAVKSGWFCDTDEVSARTHAVTVTTLPDGSVRGTAVLTAVPLGAEERAEYTATYREGDEVLPVHERLAGPLIASTTQGLLTSLPA